jgi:hypothetical protein
MTPISRPFVKWRRSFFWQRELPNPFQSLQPSYVVLNRTRFFS